MDKLLTQLKNLLAQLLGLLKKQPQSVVINPITETPQVIPTPIKSIKWGEYPENMKMDLIGKMKQVCKEVGLSDNLTIDLIRTCWAESGLNPNCVNPTTFDYGISQFSKKYYLVEFKMTPQEALDNPLKCVKIMAQCFKQGRQNNWVAYSSKNYLKCPEKYYQ